MTLIFFFFNDTATTEIYTLSLHDALPISRGLGVGEAREGQAAEAQGAVMESRFLLDTNICIYIRQEARSEEHTSELQSQSNLVCRLLLEKKKKRKALIVSY